MELDDSSKSSSEEMDRSNDHEMGTGRFYECVFCKRGFTTAQALGGHMNIHRKDRANNKAKPNFPPSSSTKVVDDDESTYNYASNPGFSTRGKYYPSTDPEVDNINYNYYHQLYFPSHASCGAKSPPSHVQYSEVLCVENQRDPHLLFGQDWRQRGLSLYTNPLCVHENKDKIENNTEEDVLDLELRLGHYP